MASGLRDDEASAMSAATKVERYEFDNASNYYGCLEVRRTELGCEWCVENWNVHHWRPIPEYLFDALKRYWQENQP
tara:strand:+ start:225 stop:452 length:228 start_codon:yes stop_codon:yes gene_type:complete